MSLFYSTSSLRRFSLLVFRLSLLRRKTHLHGPRRRSNQPNHQRHETSTRRCLRLPGQQTQDQRVRDRRRGASRLGWVTTSSEEKGKNWAKVNEYRSIVHLHFHLGHLADAFIQSYSHSVHLSEEEKQQYIAVGTVLMFMEPSAKL